MLLASLVRDFHNRTAGMYIRGQEVESVELTIDTNGVGNALRYFLNVFFKEPATFKELPQSERLLRRIFWDTDFAVVNLSADEVEAVLRGDMLVDDSRWILQDELRSG